MTEKIAELFSQPEEPLSEEELQSVDTVRALCKRSLWATAYILCGYTDVDTDLHHEMTQWAEEQINAGEHRLEVIIPRGHLKSSIFSVAMIIWHLINNPNDAIALITATTDQARKYVSEAQDIIAKGPGFRSIFPELVPDTSSVWWDKNHLSIVRTKHRREPSLTGLGAHSAVTGSHFDVIIVDDLIDEESAKKPAEIRWRVDRFRHIDPLFVSPEDGLLILIGTPWVKGDVLQVAMKTGEFVLYHRGVFGEPGADHGTPIWVSRFSVEHLAGIKKRMGSWGFTHQYLCTYLDQASNPIQPEYFRFYRIEHRKDTGPTLVSTKDSIDVFEIPLRELTQLYLTHDPSMGKTTSDPVGTVVTAVDREHERIFILETFSERIPPDQQIHKLISLALKWRVPAIHIEEVGLQGALSVFMRNEIAKRRLHLSVQPLTSHGVNKGVRIQGLVPFFEAGQIYMLQEQEDLYKQLVNFSPAQYTAGKDAGVTDDLVDALAYQVRFWSGLGLGMMEPAEGYEDADEDEQPDMDRGELGYGF